MKRILLVIGLILGPISIQAQSNTIRWLSLEEAMAAQRSNPKKIMMDVYTDWCGPCKILDKYTFQHPDVVAYVNENYYAVKFNAEGDEEIHYKEAVFKNPGYDPNRKGRNAQHEFARALSIQAYPTIVFFNENGDTLMPLKGYKTPGQLELYLKLFYNDDHKKINTKEEWEQYQKAFVPAFKS